MAAYGGRVGTAALPRPQREASARFGAAVGTVTAAAAALATLDSTSRGFAYAPASHGLRGLSAPATSALDHRLAVSAKVSSLRALGRPLGDFVAPAVVVMGVVVTLFRRIRQRRQPNNSMMEMLSQLESAMGTEDASAGAFGTAMPTPTSLPPTASSSFEVPAAAQSTSTSSSSVPGSSKKGLGSWLWADKRKAKVPTLSALFGSSEADDAVAGISDSERKFMIAVASQLCLDVPDGVFDDVAGLKKVPASIPLGTRTALLHAAVKSEAEALQAKDCARHLTAVSKSMLMHLVDRVADLRDRSEAIEALDAIRLFVASADQLRGELAADVEAGLITYEGSLRPKSLEELYGMYLDISINEMQDQTTKMMSGGFAAFGDPTIMQKMEESAEKRQLQEDVLAKILGVPKGKAAKISEARLKESQEQMQKDMMAGLGLGDMGGLGALGDLAKMAGS